MTHWWRKIFLHFIIMNTQQSWRQVFFCIFHWKWRLLCSVLMLWSRREHNNLLFIVSFFINIMMMYKGKRQTTRMKRIFVEWNDMKWKKIRHKVELSWVVGGYWRENFIFFLYNNRKLSTIKKTTILKHTTNEISFATTRFSSHHEQQQHKIIVEKKHSTVWREKFHFFLFIKKFCANHFGEFWVFLWVSVRCHRFFFYISCSHTSELKFITNEKA